MKPLVLLVGLLTFLLALPLLAFAQGDTVYRCQTPDGVIFSGTPCGANAEKTQLQPAPLVQTRMSVSDSQRQAIKRTLDARKKAVEKQALSQRVDTLQQQLDDVKARQQAADDDNPVYVLPQIGYWQRRHHYRGQHFPYSWNKKRWNNRHHHNPPPAPASTAPTSAVGFQSLMHSATIAPETNQMLKYRGSSAR